MALRVEPQPSLRSRLFGEIRTRVQAYQTDANDPGCVETRKIETRLELHSPCSRFKLNVLASLTVETALNE